MNPRSLRGSESCFARSVGSVFLFSAGLCDLCVKRKRCLAVLAQFAFEDHLEQTKEHVERLDEIFKRLDERPTGKTCKGMKGLIEEGSEILEKDGDESVLDAALIGAAQRVEHYEIAGYGTVRTFANMLGENEAAELLQQTLDEEGEADKLLTELAESVINVEAPTGGR